MMGLPSVSVIIPTYNRAGIIAQTIDNIFEQTYRNIEVIVVDDGSTDDTAAVLKSYGERVLWTVQKNSGPSAARNRGIAMARGEIVAFQDSDDAWHPSKIERQVSLLQRAGESVPCCICNTDIYTAEGRVVDSFGNAGIDSPFEEGIWTNVADVLATRFIIFNQAATIRRSAVEKIGGFDERLKCLEDHEMAIRLAYLGPWGFIRTPLVMQKQGTANSISRHAIERPVLLAENYVQKWKIVLERLPENGEGARLRPVIGRQLKHAKRDLKIAKMIRGTSQAGRAIGYMASKVERLRAALGRRLPGYPQIQVQAVPPSSNVKFGSRMDEARSMQAPTFQ